MGRLILASASPRRAELLGQLGVEFEVCPVDIDESRAREIFEKLAHSPRTTAPRERNDPVVARKGVSFEIARFLTLSTDRTSSIDEARETIKTV